MQYNPDAMRMLVEKILVTDQMYVASTGLYQILEVQSPEIENGAYTFRLCGIDDTNEGFTKTLSELAGRKLDISRKARSKNREAS